ncbi:MAG: ferrochelatase [Bdellovibrionaceae bacterium]|nr:ferrochelatase [Pseudobdellovibrionaceae bacterium]
MKKALILNNIGTPASPRTADVKVYLDEFLMDPDVIGLPFPLRWLLVKGLITPRRSPQSAAKYRAIWTPEGSPLAVHTERFADKLREILGPDWIVRVGMRYGEPSLFRVLRELRESSVETLVFAPLFPQFAQATSGSAIKTVKNELEKMSWSPELRILPAFHDREEFLRPQAELIRPHLAKADHVLFSFHGLPESQIREAHGGVDEKCDAGHPCRANCYKTQSLTTAKDLARLLELPEGRWSASFQSRLGPAKWIGPSTDDTIKVLAAGGVKNLVVACPSFVADCLETLEEIGLGGKEDFLHAGGREFTLVPCVNEDDAWARGFVKLIQ